MNKARFYSARPMEVEAYQITDENAYEIARWCKGMIRDDNPGICILLMVQRFGKPKRSKAVIGDWLVWVRNEPKYPFKIFHNDQFHKKFKPGLSRGQKLSMIQELLVKQTLHEGRVDVSEEILRIFE